MKNNKDTNPKKESVKTSQVTKTNGNPQNELEVVNLADLFAENGNGIGQHNTQSTFIAMEPMPGDNIQLEISTPEREILSKLITITMLQWKHFAIIL